MHSHDGAVLDGEDTRLRLDGHAECRDHRVMMRRFAWRKISDRDRDGILIAPPEAEVGKGWRPWRDWAPARPEISGSADRLGSLRCLSQNGLATDLRKPLR